ncbi:MAG: transcriptional repressor [Bacteroidetes bacterium]|jgi:Fe2+ or Zn2+ uptake regulation protein|nr:transcriptional repressor [Bacteroidota bacterium]MBT6686928.1 transcriptional repressor [Bacteroidota bacterium]MBT7143218.1 transcriptional repressor [Bacteroidota bacterium]MBT7492804.1 transcriptional repressor [Bacteroidota bacterium]
MDNFGEYLKDKGVKPSYQRIKIFEYLYRNKNHPTVDMIYKELVNEIPTLSKTTVYNTLKLFSGKNIILLINIEENELRFDADTTDHGHFKCTKCGNILDFDIDLSEINTKNIEKYKIDETHLYIKGMCDKCK